MFSTAVIVLTAAARCANSALVAAALLRIASAKAVHSGISAAVMPSCVCNLAIRSTIAARAAAESGGAAAVALGVDVAAGPAGAEAAGGDGACVPDAAPAGGAGGIGAGCDCAKPAGADATRVSMPSARINVANNFPPEIGSASMAVPAAAITGPVPAAAAGTTPPAGPAAAITGPVPAVPAAKAGLMPAAAPRPAAARRADPSRSAIGKTDNSVAAPGPAADDHGANDISGFERGKGQ